MSRLNAIENASTEVSKAITLCKVMCDDYINLKSIIPAGCYDEDIEVLFSVQLDILDIARSILDSAAWCEMPENREWLERLRKESADKKKG